ncbi:MAG: hypothetical protein GF320_14325 [Armatimonadia bacterium]|nr:hypothetical protein [Armatimonadia bacterium]
MAAVLEQTHFRFAPQTAWAKGIPLWAAAEDAALSEWPRFLPFYLIEQYVNSGDTGASVQPALEWRVAGGNWQSLTSSDSDAIYVMENGWYRSEISTTIRQLTGSGTFVNGKIVTGSDRVGAAYTLNAGNITEVVWSLTMGSGATRGVTYELRSTNAGTAWDAYANSPSMTCADWKELTLAATADGEAWDDGTTWDDSIGYVKTGPSTGAGAYSRFSAARDVLPRNATIYYAALRPWVRSVTGSGVTQVNVQVLDSSAVPTLTSDPGLLAYGADVDWDQTTELIAAAHNVAGAQVCSPNIKDHVQAWLNGDLSGGVPGDDDHLGLRVMWQAGKSLDWYTYDHTAPKPMELYVAYTAPYQPYLSDPILMTRGAPR